MTIQESHVTRYRRNQNNKARKAAKKAANKSQRGIVGAYHNIYDAVNEQRKQQANGRRMAGYNSYNDAIDKGFQDRESIIVGYVQDAHVKAYQGR